MLSLAMDSRFVIFLILIIIKSKNSFKVLAESEINVKIPKDFSPQKEGFGWGPRIVILLVPTAGLGVGGLGGLGGLGGVGGLPIGGVGGLPVGGVGGQYLIEFYCN